MRTSPAIRRLVVWLLALPVALLLVCPASRAAEPLRWKFRVGEQLNYNTSQDMTMNMNAGPAGQMQMTMRQVMDMNWRVAGVNESGDASIEQSIDRVQMSMTAPGGQGFEYDTNAEGPAEGLGTMVAPLFEAMTEGQFAFTMTPRGEIRDVQVPPNVLEAMKNSPGAAAMGDMASAEGIKRMIMQGALVLPEETPQPGESWSNSISMNNPAVGKQTVETTYTYEGTREVDDVTMAVFRPTLKMDIEGGAQSQMQMDVVEQQSDGEVLFNQDAGRLDSSRLKQKTKIDVTIGGQTMQQEIDQVIEAKVTPVAAE